MWRGSVMNFSMNMRSSPKEDFASDFERAKPSATSDLGIGDAHTLAAAAGGRLDHHRVADLLGDLHRLDLVAITPRWPGTVETCAAAAAFFELDLVTHRRDGFGVRPDEHDAGGFQRLGEGLTFGQEAVAGMHGLGARRFAGRQNLVDQQVAFGRLGRADGDGGIGHLHVQGVLVGLRKDRDRLDPHAAGRLDDPAGDFAAVGDQDALEHEGKKPSAIPVEMAADSRRLLQYCLAVSVSSAATQQR